MRLADFCMGLAIACIVMHVIHFFAGCYYQRDLREEAVKRGHAEWVVVDERNGTTEWRWKP